jgi:hypothetical protein
MSTKGNHNKTLSAFTPNEMQKAKILLATQVAHMMGRKLEEDDWNKVYCGAKNIPHTGWSNLNIDVNHNGLGVEQKLLRCPVRTTIKSYCGTTLMHPSATRSIRISDTSAPANDVMIDVFKQYAELIDIRTKKVIQAAPNIEPDMRTGWLLWEDSLQEFLYFEQKLVAPNPSDYYAEWNVTAEKGARKASKSLWIYDRISNNKRFSITTNAGIKIQPYFDVPSPKDPNLYYFRAQSERVSETIIQIWVSARTARALKRVVGDFNIDRISQLVIEASKFASDAEVNVDESAEYARPIQLTVEAFRIFHSAWEGVSDEHRAQLFLETLHNMK